MGLQRSIASDSLDREQVFSNLTSKSTVVSPDRGRSVTFDREGRWLFYFRAGRTFKRALDSQVHLRFRRAGRQRRTLTSPEAERLFGEIHELSIRLRDVAGEELRQRLDSEILRWTPELLAAEKLRFETAYHPVAILPPDQYLSIVLQATEGCSWNACTFCNFYLDRPFEVKSPERFSRHILRVKELIGKGLTLRKGLFLGDGNALAMSNHRLEPLIEIAKTHFPARDLFGFVDLYTGERRAPGDWRRLASLGLKRVYVGMETGSDELLHLVNKPGSTAELERFVVVLKDAGLSVSLIVMVGLGGRELRSRHRTATYRSIARMPLDRSDLLYLSPFVEHPGSEYVRRRVESGMNEMNETEVEEELADFAHELRAVGLRVSRYDIREFVY